MSESKGLLILRVPHILEREEHERVGALIDPIAKALGVKALILGPGAEAQLQYDNSAQLDRICTLLEALVAQGKPKANYPSAGPMEDAVYNGRNGNGYQPHPLPPARSPAKPPSER